MLGRPPEGGAGSTLDLFNFSELNDAFRQGEEYVVVRAKLRPCAVLSHDDDIRDLTVKRIVVVPIFSYNNVLLRGEVERGERPHLFHIKDSTACDLRAGYADFTLSVGMPTFFFGAPSMNPVCRMQGPYLESFLEAHAAWLHPVDDDT